MIIIIMIYDNNNNNSVYNNSSMEMKEILREVKQRLAVVEGLKVVAEDWGQLQREPVLIGFPCALIDVQGVGYGQLGSLAQMVEGTLTVAIADDGLEEGVEDFATLGLVEDVNGVIHGCVAGGCARMVCKSVERVVVPGVARVYKVVYQFAFQTQPRVVTTAVVGEIVIR